MNSINVYNNKIILPNGFPKLEKNGDYHIIHENDNILRIPKIKQQKLDQLVLWTSTTFNYIDNNNHLDQYMKEAFNIFKSDKNVEFIKLINWLNSEDDD